MPKQFIKRLSKVPPHVAIVTVLVAVVGASGAALLLTRSEPKVEALTAPRAARIERVDGSVALAHSLSNDAQPDWAEATLNTPLTVGDRIYADDGSHAAVAFTGRNYARLNPGASLDVLSLSDRRTQLALRDGSAIFDIGDLRDDELFEIATPNGAVDFTEPGLYQVGIDDSGNSIISVLSGLAQVVGLAGTGQISKGEILTLAGQAAAQILLSKIAPDLAGGIVDDYYGYRYPNTYDGRYSDYNAYLDDPYYYDPYRESAGYRYLSEDIPGVYDLDRYGDWTDVDGYGQCWAPRVSAGWSPYRYGYWDLNDTWGPTWVSQEAWGYAPYHYGRWAYVNNQRWVWVPADAIRQPVYAPALVAFIPLQQTNQIGWVPLAPGEQYVPRYYDAGYRPQYLAPAEVVTQVVSVQQSYANINYPAAVTVIPEQYFTREIDPRAVATADQQLIAQAQPMLDPFAIDSLRQAALSDKDARRRIRVPGDVQQEVFSTPVITSVQPLVPQVRPDVYQALQTEQVGDKQRKRKLKFDESGQVVAARRWDGLPQPPAPQTNASPSAQEREQRIAALASQAAQGDKSARREMRELKREQRLESRAAREQATAAQPATQQDVTRQQRKEQKRMERAQREAAMQQQQVSQQQAGQQPQAEQTRSQRKEQKRLERQQREAALQQQVATQQQSARQQNEQRKLMRQQARAQRAQQEAAAQQAQVNQPREQVKAQRRAERQQRAMIEEQQRQSAIRQASQQAQYNQEREARKAQKRAERQQREQQVMNQQRAIEQQRNEQRKQMIFMQQADRDRQQRKMERRAAREQAQPPQAAPQVQSQRAPAYMGPPAQQSQPDKAQRRAEREQRKAEKRKP